MNPAFNFKCYSGYGILGIRNLITAFGPCFVSILVHPDGGRFKVRLMHPKYIMYFDSVEFPNLRCCYRCLKPL